MSNLYQDVMNLPSKIGLSDQDLEHPDFSGLASDLEHPGFSSDTDNTDSYDSDSKPTAADKKEAERIEQPADKLINGGPQQPTIGDQVDTALAPEQSEVNALPSEYSSVMSQLGALPSGTNSDNSALNSAISATESAEQSGEGGVESALAKEGPAVSTLAQDLPYADVLSTALTQKKNELLYGTTTGEEEYAPSEQGWSKNLKDIYGYINGTLAGSTPQTDAGLSSTGSPGTTTLPGVVAAAGETPSGSIPSGGNAATGGSGGL